MNTIGKIIGKYRRAKGMSQIDIADELEKRGISLSHKAVSSWERGASLPNAVQLLELMKLLDIYDIYEDYFGSNPAYPETKLNEEGQKLVDEYTQLLIESGKYRKPPVLSPQGNRIMRFYNIPASAGSGEFLDSDDFEEIEVEYDIPVQADFGIRIKGDSMLPIYVDQQIVWVHQQSELNDGEIGIFYYDGNAYIKKWQNNQKGTFLISLNKKYEPIPVLDISSLKIFGKVV